MVTRSESPGRGHAAAPNVYRDPIRHRLLFLAVAHFKVLKRSDRFVSFTAARLALTFPVQPGETFSRYTDANRELVVRRFFSACRATFSPKLQNNVEQRFGFIFTVRTFAAEWSLCVRIYVTFDLLIVLVARLHTKTLKQHLI